jgi:hypothetical protein
MLEYPSNIRFDPATAPQVLRVSYAVPPASPRLEARVLADPLDLWAVLWILNHDWPHRVVDVRAPRGLSRAAWRTLLLRLDALQDSLDGFSFLVDGTARWADEITQIRTDIRSAHYLAYDRSNVHREAGPEHATSADVFEKWLGDHNRKFLEGTFVHGHRRQLPAAVFKATIREANRVTAKARMDLLGVDSEGRLAPVVLAPGRAAGLADLARGLDQAVFCRDFRPHLKRNWYPETTSERIALYVIADGCEAVLAGTPDAQIRPFVEAFRASPWLDVVLVGIVSTDLPSKASERVLFRSPVPPVPAEAPVPAAP